MPDRPAARRHRRRAVLVLTVALAAAGGAGALAVAAPSGSTVSVSVSPGTLSLSAGDQGAHDVTIKRKSFAGAVGLSVSGLPAGASGAFAPASTTGTASKLTVTTTPATPLGTYTFTIAGSSTLGTSDVTVKLTLGQVVQSAKSFAIAGPLNTKLVPGATAPVGVSITNPNNQAISVTNLNVSVVVRATPNSTPGNPCRASDFAVTQMAPASYPVPVPANSTRSLSQFMADSTRWPQVRMLETGGNQDGCKNASLSLTYTGTAQGGN